MQHLFVYIATVSICLMVLVLIVLNIFKNIAKPQSLISANLIPLRYITRQRVIRPLYIYIYIYIILQYVYIRE